MTLKSIRLRPLSATVAIAIIVILSAIPFFGGAYVIAHFTRILIYVIFAMSLDLLVGYCGLVSLGHAAFFGVSAYTAALLAIKAGITNMLIALPVSLMAAAVVAFIIGLLTLRMTGIYFIMATLAFAQMLYFLVNDNSYFGGSNGLLVFNRIHASVGQFILLDLADRPTRYFVTLVAAVATFVGLLLLVRSPFGRVLQGIKSNEQRMRALGYRVGYYKLGCFVIGGTLGGLAGYLYILLTSLADPSILDWLQSAQVLMMVILGGLGTLIGPAAGAFLLIELIDQTAGVTEHWKLIVGVVVIAITLFFRGGLMGAALRIRRFGARAST
ncbi:MAG TPA: branched-chain amino acid ABC transporter permease [Sphingomicrobium sp.]|nr:branched-chain amino acid ABC transporter permease [Sphingomicrobium sp.]